VREGVYCVSIHELVNACGEDKDRETLIEMILPVIEDEVVDLLDEHIRRLGEE